MGDIYVCQDVVWSQECRGTFQRMMDIEFSKENDRLVVVYLDDITMFSNREEYHLKHSQKIIQKCIKFVISINPNKSVFSLITINLLGQIISNE